MRYYDSLGAAGYPISRPCTTMPCSFQEHLDRGSAGGVDYAVKMGSPIPAPTRGRVRNWRNASAGNAVDFFHIDDNGVETGFFDQFMHLMDGGFVAEGVYNPGDTIGYSGNTGSSTGPHIHWNARLNGRVVRQWEYFTNEPTKKQGADMYYNRVAAGWQYVVGAEYIRVISPEEVPHVRWNMGEPKEHATLNDFVLWCKALNIPEDKVRALSSTNRTWSKLDTIAGGGGATPGEIAQAVDASLKDDFAGIPKSVNDDAAKRMSS